jgi:hypothetical protein
MDVSPPETGRIDTRSFYIGDTKNAADSGESTPFNPSEVSSGGGMDLASVDEQA